MIKPDEPDILRKGWLCSIKSQCSIQDSDKPMDSLASLARGLSQSSDHQTGRHLGLYAFCASISMGLELRMYEYTVQSHQALAQLRRARVRLPVLL